MRVRPLFLLCLLKASTTWGVLRPLPCQILIASRPFLYELTYRGQRGYLLGTQHVGVKLEDYSDDLATLISQANAIVLETGKKMYGETRESRPQTGRPAKISDTMSDEAWRVLSGAIRLQNVDPERVDTFTPRELLTLVNVDLRLFGRGVIEDEIIDIGRQRGIEPTALDDRQRLDDLFAELTVAKLEEEVLARRNELLDPNRFHDTETRLREFLLGDETAEIARFEKNRKTATRFTAEVTDRNARWLPKLMGQFRNDGHFFAVVGASHLWGDVGLIQLLKQSRVRVERLK